MRFAAIALLALAVSGCEQSPKDPLPITLETFCNDYPAAACANRIECGVYSDSDAGLSVCLMRETIAESCRRAGAGFIEFDGVEAARCLIDLKREPLRCPALSFAPCNLNGSGLSSVTTGVFSRRENACGTTSCGPDTTCDERCDNPQCLPPLAMGEACNRGDGLVRNCVAGTTCGSQDGGAPSCVALTPRGGDCSQVACEEQDYCSHAGVTPTCLEKLPRDASCTEHEMCLEGLCRSGGHCGALEAGGGCVQADDCASDLICLGLELSPQMETLKAGVCTRRPRRGESCTRNSALGEVCRENEGDACLDGVCKSVRPDSLPEGAECPLHASYWTVPFHGTAACQRGLTCTRQADEPSTGRCRTKWQPGQPARGRCDSDWQCPAGLVCEWRGVCAALVGLGETCGLGRSCTADLFCHDSPPAPDPMSLGRCGPLIEVGAGCVPTRPGCEPGAYCGTQANICVASAPVGAACAIGSPCASGECQLGLCVAQCLR